jgi:hypothetical protein
MGRIPGSYIGIRPPTPTTSSAIGIWPLHLHYWYKRGATWPPSNGSDQDFSSVSLLLHMDGSNASTTFTDSSSNAFSATANGNAQISTTQSKFGGASGKFDGSGDYVQITSATALELGSGDFTIELWYYHDGGNQTFAGLVGKGPVGSTPSDAWTLEFGGSGIIFVPWAASTETVTTTEPSQNAWHHVAVTRSGSTLRLFVDGVQSASNTVSFTVGTNNSGPLVIGGGAFAPSTRSFSGYIDDLRITKGVARYTAGFTPPTAAFPDS